MLIRNFAVNVLISFTHSYPPTHTSDYSHNLCINDISSHGCIVYLDGSYDDQTPQWKNAMNFLNRVVQIKSGGDRTLVAMWISKQ